MQLLIGDITEQNTDALVNAANSNLAHGLGVAGAIARKAGKILEEESRSAPFVPVGDIYTTSAGDLPSKYVIHAVGPIWDGGNHKEEELLTSCIVKALLEADNLRLSSISFPAISTGVFSYPLEEAAKVILNAIINHLSQNDSCLTEIRIILFTKNDFDIFVSVLKQLI